MDGEGTRDGRGGGGAGAGRVSPAASGEFMAQDGQHTWARGSYTAYLQMPSPLLVVSRQNESAVLQGEAALMQTTVLFAVVALSRRFVRRSSDHVLLSYMSKKTPPPLRTPFTVTFCSVARQLGFAVSTTLMSAPWNRRQHVSELLLSVAAHALSPEPVVIRKHMGVGLLMMLLAAFV